MKILFSILLLALTTEFCLAQDFGTPDSRWVFDYAGAWSTGITEVQYEKDTLIAGELIRKFSKKATRKRTIDGQLSSFDLKPVYIRSIDGLIEFSEDAILYNTLINYKARIGHSWKIYRYWNSVITDSIQITIVDTFRTEISGVRLFTQAAEYKSPGWSTFIDTIYEYIGLKWLYILPFDDKDVSRDGGEGGIIRCFKNELLGIVSFDNLQYGSNYKYNCNNLTNIENNSNGTTVIDLYSTPIRDNLQIVNKNNKFVTIRVLNIYGDQVYERTIMPGIQLIDLSALSNGIYFISMDGNIIGKIVKI